MNDLQPNATPETTQSDSVLVSIVTPCLNAGRTIQQTIESVASTQNTVFEHIVVDGGSTDGTQDIVDRYPHLIRIDGRDDGPYDAVNRGLERATGKILCWLNADDFYLPGALDLVGTVFTMFPQIQWLTTSFPLYADTDGLVAKSGYVSGYSRARALRPRESTDATPPALLQQESTFFSRGLWEQSGSRLDTRYEFAADLDLWYRFWSHAELFAVDTPLGCFRMHDAQRSRVHANRYLEECAEIYATHGVKPLGTVASILRKAALASRGLPQGVLRYLPGTNTQTVVKYQRSSGQWVLDTRYAWLP